MQTPFRRDRSIPDPVSMAHRPLWNVPCTAHRSTDGQPRQAWSIRGGYVCRSHGGSIGHVRRAAEERLAVEVAWRKATMILVRGIADFQDRIRAEPEAVVAETLAWMRPAEHRLARFKAVHGRLPRPDEYHLILGG